MTISSTTAKSGPYTGNGSTTVFAYTFKILANTEIEVVLTSTAGVETVKTLTTHYTVSGVGVSGGGNVTMVTAPATGEKLTLRRKMSFLQETDLQNQGTFYADDVETMVDRQNMNNLENREKLTRALKIPVSDSTGTTVELPTETLRANKALIFDADGNVTTSTDDYEDQAAAAAASAAAASASAASIAASEAAAAASAAAAAASETSASGSAVSAQASAAAAAASAASGLFGALANKSTDYTIVADTDNSTLFIVDTSGGNVALTLPSIATAGEGERYGFMRTSASNSLTLSRNGSDTINGAAGNYTLPAVAGEVTVILADDATPDNWILLPWTQAVADETTLTKSGSTISIKSGGVGLTQMATAAKTEVIAIACSDETTALTAGTGKIAFRMPYAFTVTAVRASLTTAQTSGSTFTVDINETGTSILGTKLTIDNTEKTSTTAATAATITDTALADDAEITVDIDQIGDGTANGLKVYLIGYKA